MKGWSSVAGRSTGSAPSFCSAVDRQVDGGVLGEARQRDLEAARLRRGALRRRDADDLETLRHPFAQSLDNEKCGRPGAEADHHAVLDVLDRAIGRSLF